MHVFDNKPNIQQSKTKTQISLLTCMLKEISTRFKIHQILIFAGLEPPACFKKLCKNVYKYQNSF